MFQLRTFGRLTLQTDEGEPAEEVVRHEKGVALLAYLAAEAIQQRVPREEVASLLWPDRTDERARNNLRVTLSRLRDASDVTLIRGKGGPTLWLNTDRVRSDVRAFQRALDEDEAAEAVALYRGDFLAGFHVPDASAFNRWVDRRRGEFRRQAYRAALSWGERAQSENDLEVAEAAYRRALDLEPLREEAAGQLMEVLVEQGERADALQLFQAFRRRLQEDLEVSPSESLREFADEIRRRADEVQGPADEGVAADPAAEAGIGDGRRPSLAVLPFRDLSPAEDQAYFAEGLAEELLDALAQLSDLEIVGRTASFGLEPGERDLETLQSRLGVSHVLTGSVRRADERVRVNAALLDVATGYQQWSDRFDHHLEDIFEVQETIARSVANALRVELLDEEGPGRLVRDPDVVPEAYDLYLRGRHLWYRRHEIGVRAALDRFQEASELDPDYAAPHVGVAEAYFTMGHYRFLPVDAARAKTQAAIDRALEADPGSGGAYRARGLMEAYLDGDWEKAESSFARAVELQPRDALAHLHRGLARASRSPASGDEIFTSVRRARSLEPEWTYGRAVLALIYTLRKERQAARSQIDKVRREEPEWLLTFIFSGWVRSLSGEHDEAVSDLKRAAALSDHPSLLLGFLGAAHGLAGNVGEAERIRDELNRRAEQEETFVSPQALGVIEAALGHTERALVLLRREIREQSAGVAPFLRLPYWDAVRPASEYEAICREAGIDPYTQ